MHETEASSQGNKKSTSMIMQSNANEAMCVSFDALKQSLNYFDCFKVKRVYILGAISRFTAIGLQIDSLVDYL